MNYYDIMQVVMSGVVTECVYAILAVSCVVIAKSTQVVNFATGETLMLGAYFAMLALMYFNFPYVAAFGLAIIGMAAVGAGFDRLVLRSIASRHRTGPFAHMSLVLATVGLAYMLRGGVRLFSFTEEPHRIPPVFSGPPIIIGHVVLQRQDLVIVLATILIMLLLFAFFQFTLIGRVLRASSQNPRAAALAGVPIERMRRYVWAGGCALGGIAGVLIAGKLPITPDFGSQVVQLAFAAAVIGGFNSLPGCVVGGILLGVVQNLVGYFISSSAIAVAPFVIIMLVLVLLPQGLFGGQAILRKV